MRLTISPLTQLTPEVFSDLNKLSFATDEATSLTWLEQALAQDSAQLWIATFNDKCIGLVLLEQDGQEYWLNYIEVREATRQRGVGTFLLQQALLQLPKGSVVKAECPETSSIAKFLKHMVWTQYNPGSWSFQLD
ncbi:acetyl-CoA sensor PanZ family protein [Echinimonas agarilytica]|uniref:PanM family protein n=1 Tax=Echinimonas agarilytica TaxID=1215918 RepID=A0AA42B8J9_9GAMM|nr:acetyl-CoA sensor PanZ family protein [Echinimonas agarilytica]MCM2681039.1 PanM family protein [Echinimonas agarilytica]